MKALFFSLLALLSASVVHASSNLWTCEGRPTFADEIEVQLDLATQAGTFQQRFRESGYDSPVFSCEESSGQVECSFDIPPYGADWGGNGSDLPLHIVLRLNESTRTLALSQDPFTGKPATLECAGVSN